MKALLLLGVFFLASCTEQGATTRTLDDNASGNGGDDFLNNNTQVTYSDINRAILSPYGCMGCHSGSTASAGFRVDSEAGLKRAIVAGSPFSSKIFIKLRNGEMPPSGQDVTTSDLELLENYINQLN